jgi:flagellum-specific ATP synthase
VRHRDLITVGAYQSGSDPRLDQAIAMWPAIEGFLSQSMHEKVELQPSIDALAALAAQITRGKDA